MLYNSYKIVALEQFIIVTQRDDFRKVNFSVHRAIDWIAPTRFQILSIAYTASNLSTFCAQHL